MVAFSFLSFPGECARTHTTHPDTRVVVVMVVVVASSFLSLSRENVFAHTPRNRNPKGGGGDGRLFLSLSPEKTPGRMCLYTHHPPRYKGGGAGGGGRLLSLSLPFPSLSNRISIGIPQAGSPLFGIPFAGLAQSDSYRDPPNWISIGIQLSRRASQEKHQGSL